MTSPRSLGPRQGVASAGSVAGERPPGADRLRWSVAEGGPQLGDLLSMGVTLATCLAAGLGLGWLGDHAFATTPALTLLGIALGIAAACVYAYKLFQRYM